MSVNVLRIKSSMTTSAFVQPIPFLLEMVFVKNVMEFGALKLKDASRATKKLKFSML